MSMLHDNDNDYMEMRKAKTGVILGCILASSAVVLVLLVTFMMNKSAVPVKNETAPKEIVKTEETADLKDIHKEDKKTSNELSFWHMYDEDSAGNTALPDTRNMEEGDRVKERFIPEEKESVSEDGVSDNNVTSQEKQRLEAVSENRFDVNTLSEGEGEFTGIISGIPLNNRFEEGFETEGIWRDYALNGKKTSFRGIDVSSYQKNIDWERVAAAGVDFAMIRSGSRGYGSGKIVLDERCEDNMRGCSENGIKIGLYYESQAVNVLEAIEEANYCLASINEHTIEYPIVFVSEAVINDSYRTENLSKEELTAAAKAFCDTVRAYGFTPMIGATKKQLALKMDLTILSDYDIWLFDTDEVSVFPYRYNMWQYSETGEVDGIDGYVDLDISFTDYSVK